MRKVRYKVGKSGFALYDIGDIIDGYLVAQDEDTGVALIFFPEDEEGCGSVTLCKEDIRHKEETFINLYDDSYVNLDGEAESLFSDLTSKV